MSVFILIYFFVLNDWKNMNINKELEKLYNKHWASLVENANGKKSAHPLLIKVNNEYQDADIKVMIIGQETDGWNGSFEEKKKSIHALMDDYYNYFYNIATTDSLKKRLTKKHKRPFWNKKNFKYFQEKLQKEFPEKKISFIWNNVSKIGKLDSGKQTDTIKQFEEEYFKDVFQQEIEILKPNVMIFTIGNRHIPVQHNSLKNIKEEQVSEVIFDEFPNIFAVRTYHPNARIQGGKKHLKEQVFEMIVQKVNSNAL